LWMRSSSAVLALAISMPEISAPISGCTGVTVTWGRSGRTTGFVIRLLSSASECEGQVKAIAARLAKHGGRQAGIAMEAVIFLVGQVLAPEGQANITGAERNFRQRQARIQQAVVRNDVARIVAVGVGFIPKAVIDARRERAERGIRHHVFEAQIDTRSEEHTSELQSRENLVC